MGYGDKIQDNSLIVMEEEVFGIINDLRGRINEVFDKYLISDTKVVPSLPPFEKLVKDYKLHYKTSVKLVECIDELQEMKMRVSMVYRELSGICNTQVSDRSNYNFINNFKKNLEKYMSELDGYRYDLVDIIKNTNNKLKILESISYYRED